MGTEFGVHVAAEEVRLDLGNLARACADTMPFMVDVGAYMMASVGKNFEQEQAPSGEAWVPLKASTLAGRKGYKSQAKTAKGKARFRARQGSGTLKRVSGRILQDTGQHLKGSISADATNSRVRIGPAWKLSAVHQFGTKRAGRGNKTTIPARPFLGFRPEDPAAIEQLAKAHVDKAMPH